MNERESFDEAFLRAPLFSIGGHSHGPEFDGSGNSKGMQLLGRIIDETCPRSFGDDLKLSIFFEIEGSISESAGRYKYRCSFVRKRLLCVTIFLPLSEIQVDEKVFLGILTGHFSTAIDKLMEYAEKKAITNLDVVGLDQFKKQVIERVMLAEKSF